MAGRVADQLALLVDLDRLDQELIALRAEEKDVPQAIATRRADLDARTAARDGLKEQLEATKKANRDGERQLEMIERRAARATKRLDGLFVSSQIDATQREIEQLAEQKDEIEMTVLEGMEEADSLAEQLAVAEKALVDGQQQLDSVAAAWEARRPELETRCGELEAAQDEVVPKIHKDTLRKYMVGLENRQNSRPRGITRTEGIMCTMCQVDIPVRWVNEARQGDGVHNCLGCKRVLVGKVLLELPEDA